MSVTTLVLDWFDNSKRELPFRNTTDPYLIWLSEIMLQQTQGDRVIPKSEFWIRR